MRAVRTALSRVLGFFRSLFGRGAPPPVGWVEIDVDDSVAALDGIEHVVVLMLENRSFDHMLGYLGLEVGGPDVDGLDETMANEHAGRSVSGLPADGDRVREDAGPLPLGRMRG